MIVQVTEAPPGRDLFPNNGRRLYSFHLTSVMVKWLFARTAFSAIGLICLEMVINYRSGLPLMSVGTAFVLTALAILIGTSIFVFILIAKTCLRPHRRFKVPDDAFNEVKAIVDRGGFCGPEVGISAIPSPLERHEIRDQAQQFQTVQRQMHAIMSAPWELDIFDPEVREAFAILERKAMERPPGPMNPDAAKPPVLH